MEVERVLNWIKSDDLRTKRIQGIAQEVDNVPTNLIAIPVDSVGVIEAGLVKPENADWIPSHLLVDLGERKDVSGKVVVSQKKYLGKQEIMILDMLKNNSDWSRPMYYAITVGSDQYLRLESYFRQDGVAYRIMPFETAKYQPVNSDVLYDNVMNKYKYGNLEQPGLYMDENSMRMAKTFRIIFGQLAQTLANEGDSVRAEKAADYCLQVIPSYNVPYDYYSVGDIADAYYKIGKKEKAGELYVQLAETSLKNLNWYNRLNNRQYISVLEDVKRDIIFMQYIMYYFAENDEKTFNRYSQEYSRYMERLQNVTGRSQKRGGLNQ
jgi:tetratricopeptide (TPR) repeat protein